MEAFLFLLLFSIKDARILGARDNFNSLIDRCYNPFWSYGCLEWSTTSQAVSWTGSRQWPSFKVWRCVEESSLPLCLWVPEFISNSWSHHSINCFKQLLLDLLLSPKPQWAPDGQWTMHNYFYLHCNRTLSQQIIWFGQTLSFICQVFQSACNYSTESGDRGSPEKG